MTNSPDLISYEYPETVKIKIGDHIYTYQSSEPYCRKFMVAINKGAGFKALQRFKAKAKVLQKEAV